MKDTKVKGAGLFFEKFLKTFNDIQILSSVLSDDDGNVISGIPANDIIRKFYSSVPACLRETGKILSAFKASGANIKRYFIYGNRLGYSECLIPAGESDGKKLLFRTGPFFTKKPDIKFFTKQAEKYGFDKQKFLDEVRKIPVCSRKYLEKYSGMLAYNADTALELENLKSRRVQIEKENRERDRKYRELINLSPDSIGVHVDGKFVYVNKATLRLLDVKSAKELIGKKVIDIVMPEYRDYVTERLKRVKNVKVLPLEEIRLVSFKGREIRAEISAMLIDYNGKPAVQGVVRDVTAKRKAEEDLIIRNAAIDSAINPMSLSTPQGRIIYVNKAFLKLYGYANLSEVKGRHFTQFTELEYRARDRYRNLLKGVPFTGESIGKRKDGTKMELFLSANTVFSKTNKPVCVITSFADISESKKAEKALRESEERFRILSEITSDFAVSIIVGKDKSLTLEWATESIERITGSKASEINYENIIIPEDRNIAENALKDILKGKEVSFDFRMARKNGSIIWLRALARPMLDDKKKKVARIYAGLTDITDKKISGIIIRRNEERFKSLFENAPIGIFSSTPEGKILDLNPRFFEILGYGSKEELIRKIDRLGIAKAIYAHPGNRAKFIERAVKSDGWQTFENEYLRKDGTIVHAIVSFRAYVNNITGALELEGFITDITELKKKENSIRESEARFGLVFENSVDAIGIMLNGIQTDVNPAYVRLFGYDDASELISRPVLDVVDPDCREEIKDKMKKRTLGIPLESVYVTNGLRKDGTIFDLSVSIAGYSMEGKTYYAAILRDVTEQRVAAAKLRKSEENLAYAQKMAQIGSWEYDVVNNSAIWSDNMFSILDADPSFTRKYVMENYLEKIVHPDDREKTAKAISDSLEGKCPYDIEYRIIRRDGSVRNMRAIADIIRNESGKPLKMIGWNQDVTERKIADDLILENERRIRTLIGNVPGIVYRCRNDKDWSMEYISEGCLELTGYKSEDLINNSLLSYNDIIFEDDRAMVWDVIQQALNEKKNYELTYRILTNGKQLKWVWEKGNGVFSDKGELIALEGLIVDITERKRMEEALEIARDKAEEMNKVKAAFFSTMSHELRTPMTGILGFSEVLNNTLADPEHKKMASVIHDAGEKLLETLNMILDVTKIEADKLELRQNVCNLSDIVVNTAELFRKTAEGKNLYLRVETEPLVFSRVDEKLFRQSVSNIIKNAVTFTREGGIKIHLYSDKKRNAAVLNILDTGIGIPSDKFELIFEPFRQVSEGWGRISEGTGLGLSITKRFIEAMGGEIKVESEVNVGSVFSVIFPLCDKPDN